MTKFRPPAKYGNVRTTIDGETFDSAAEARRYQVLKIMQRAGEISDLKRQVRFPLLAHALVPVKVADYIADYVYLDANGAKVVEDLKGVKTDVFKLKAKLFRANYGFDILVTR